MSGEGDLLSGLLIDYGLWLLAPLSLLEGPVVNVIAGWLAQIGLMPIWGALVILTLGDVAGDLILYLIGRHARADRLPLIGRHLKIPRARLLPLVRGFRQNGARILVIGKLTQAAGALVLLAAGAARMPLGPFLAINLMAAIPKTILLFLIGWMLGEAHGRISGWLGWASLLATLLAFGWLWLQLRRQMQSRADLPKPEGAA